jgi:hypothetical protein
MANIFVPTPINLSGPWNIAREDCIGDSLGYINANTNYLAYNLNTLSADKFDKAGGTITGNLTAANNLTVTGNIITPNQTAFSATLTSAAATIYTPSSTRDIVWNGLFYNIGNSYNPATGRFTAPVTGIYQFYATALPAYASAGDNRFAFYKNDSVSNVIESSINLGATELMTKGGNVWQQLRILRNLKLSAGDYITVRFISGAGALHGDGNYNIFQGHLITQIT